MATIRCRRPAMATLFEARLVGDDPEHLAAVGEAALDEVARIERLLSRHDPAAEVARINREAARAWVRVGIELFTALIDCLGWYARTEGAFDIGAAASRDAPGTPPRPLPDRLVLSPGLCAVRFTDARFQLDFGGYGKGYALDAAARVFDEFGVGSALLHGGTSSVLGRGTQEDGRPWRVGIADPFAVGAPGEVARIDLGHRGLSTSAVFDPGAGRSDILDPATGLPLGEQAACVVVAPRALEAEVLSTALLAMGEARARDYLRRDEGRLPAGLAAAWVGRDDGGRTVLRWLRGG